MNIPEGHLCCGSTGVYNILQHQIADRLRRRKIDHIHRIRLDVIATGNIGCMTQLSTATDIPIVHTIQLLNWAYRGAMPIELEKLSPRF